MRKLLFEQQNYAATQYLVMGKLKHSEDYEPLTFSGADGRFYSSFPSDDPCIDEIGEIYDRQTALALIGHHMCNVGPEFKFQLYPVYTQPQGPLYLIMGKFGRDENDVFTPMAKGPDAPLTWAKTFDGSTLPNPQLFTKEVAEDLIRMQKLYEEQNPDQEPLECQLVPVEVPTLGEYENPYLNPGKGIDVVKQAIQEQAKFLRENEDDGEYAEKTFCLPQSLGGEMVVPAVQVEEKSASKWLRRMTGLASV